MSESKCPHGSRFRDALVIINPGACNPSGVALSIVDAYREMREHENVDTKHVCQDPAIRLMVYQLAHLFGAAGHQYDLVHYMTDEAACKERFRRELGTCPGARFSASSIARGKPFAGMLPNNAPLAAAMDGTFGRTSRTAGARPVRRARRF